MSKREYYLVVYDEEKTKMCINAMPSILDEDAAKIFMYDASPTITRKDGRKFLVQQKRMFEYTHPDNHKTLFIIVDCKKIKPRSRYEY